MSSKLGNGLKILAWAAVVSACLALSLMVERSPRSKLQASQLLPLAADAMPDLRPCQDADPTLGGAGHSDADCMQCAATCDFKHGELAPIALDARATSAAPLVAVPDVAPAQPLRTMPPVSATCDGISVNADNKTTDLPLDRGLCSAPAVNTGDFVPASVMTCPKVAEPTPGARLSHPDVAPLAASNPQPGAANALPPRPDDSHNADRRADDNVQDVIDAGNDASTQASTVTMRDKANRTVATVKISSSVKREYLSAEERAEIHAAQHASRPCGNSRAAHNANACSPRVDVYEDPTTGYFTIDAQSIEIHRLAAELTTRLGHPICCHESLSGAISACVTDTSLTRALERLVGPFGYAIATLDGCSVIGTPEALQYEAQRLRDARHWEEAQAAQAQIELTAPPEQSESAERLPPVQPETETGPNAVADGVPASSSKPYEISIGNKARSLIAEGDLETTTALLQEAVSRHNDSAILYRMLAEVYLHRGMYLQARTAAQQSLALNRNNPMTNQIYGEVLKHMGEKTRATHYLEQAKFLRAQARL